MANALKITEILLNNNPEPKIELNFSTPLELLIATILSAQCTDKRVNTVTESLFKKYRSADDYANTEPAVLEEEIRSTGFYKNKARSIINCCKSLVVNFSGNVPSTIDELTSLDGVGRKTANVVLGGAFGKQVIAVDTHVLRLSNRLGLVNSKKPDTVERELMKQAPHDKWSQFNIALIIHGRQVCKAGKPLCPDCSLQNECEWPEKVF